MPRNIYTPETYAKLLAAYRKAPDNHKHACRETGISWEACARAYDRGWPKHPWAIPIRRQLELDKEAIRLATAEQMEKAAKASETKRIKDAETIRDQAIRQGAAEASAMQLATANAAAGQGVINSLLAGIVDKVARDQFAAEVKAYMTSKAPIRFKVALMKNVGVVYDLFTKALTASIEAERLRQEKPFTTFPGLGAVEMSQEEALEALKGFQKTLARAQETWGDKTAITVEPEKPSQALAQVNGKAPHKA